MTSLNVRCLISCILATLSMIVGASANADEEINFNEQIRPIFTRHCTACHGGVKAAGDVSFVNAEAVLPPDGWVVEPGDPDASIMIERIESDDPDVMMPPPDHGSKLDASEIALLRRWIEQGAQWRGHWAYETPQDPEVPSNNDAQWAKQSLDHFVLARLEAEQIAPAPQDSPERWLRRATLDVTGLPPSPTDRQEFLSDVEARGDAAYEAVADRLLNSPAYGERWASVWLDQVRYADSRGLGMDGPRNVWKYRDWVINAFNSDMPYTDFTVKQIAGDLLPDRTFDDLAATAAHRLSQSNEEGGTDDEEFRVAAVLDRVNTTWQAWQGVTFGCVQCHSHPYDPFKHEEYYKFAAFFNNTCDSDLDDDWPTVDVPVDDGDADEALDLDCKIETLNNTLWERENELIQNDQLWHPIESMTVSTNNSTKVVLDAKSNHTEYHTVDTVSRGTTITLLSDVPEGMKRITALKFTGMPLDLAKAVSDSEWGFVLSHLEARWIIPGQMDSGLIEFERVLVDEPTPHHDPQDSLDEKSKSGFAAFTRIHYPRSAAFVLKQPTEVPLDAQLQVSLRFDEFILSAFPLVARRGRIDLADDEQFTSLVSDTVDQRIELAELKEQRSKIKSTATPILKERAEEFRRPSHVFIRGLFLTKGEPVTPGTPASLPPLPDGKANRMALAEWLTSKQNPLTSRVAINRVWAILFGTGLVATEEDFGTSGERPSHPDLLDHLALRFQNEHDSRFKPAIREIILSSTYRQDSAIRPELHERDQQNRLLARGPRHRLPAEIVRDQALACAGLLTEQVGGYPVRPAIPEGVWNPFASWDKWNTAEVGDPNRYRRSIYTYTKRSIPYPMFASFDSPSREFCAPRRLRSNTPLQALMMLNDQTFAECTTGLAKRMKQSGESLADQIKFGFIVVTCREPNQRELNELIALVETYDDPKSAAAIEAVASVLLNLDETLTK
ncbi:PSD1 and planctomycete cytochrome C domain-containing protein [Rubripirellula amarantea]|nr:PSD1 and planctomycete cytochrome C domain-containing protein [Rubripirellula amarantea]